MPATRQLCRASQSVAPQTVLTTCPVCGRKVTSTSKVWIHAEGKREQRPVVPAHPADLQGEIRVKVSANRHRYPGSGQY